MLLIFFRLLTLQCKRMFTKWFTGSTQRKCPMKACAPFASILKSFSSGSGYEFVTKMYFLSSITDFGDLAHIHATESEMDVNYL